jgi:hypothetical protein
MRQPPLVYRWRWAVVRSDLPSSTKLVLLVVSLHMNPDGSNAFPSANTLANLCSMARSTVFDHLRLAESQGYVCRVRRYNSTSIYKPRAPSWAESSQPDVTYGDGVQGPDGVVQRAGRRGSSQPDTTPSVTTSLTKRYAAPASSPEGSPAPRGGPGGCAVCGMRRQAESLYCRDHSYTLTQGSTAA